MVRTMMFSISVLIGLSITSPASAQQRSLTLSDMHICCPACTKAINSAIDKVDLINVNVDQEKKQVTLRGEDGVKRQNVVQALKALADAGFYGKSDHERFKMKDESEGVSGKVKSLQLTGVHNCCGACEKAIKAAVASVEGTDELKLDKKAKEFTVTGDFESAALVKAFNKAGFYVKVKKSD